MKNGIPNKVEDMQLARACLDGNEKAQAQLFHNYSRQMMAVCMRFANDHEQAQDMLQEGFIKVFQKIEHYRGQGPLGAWIRRTMINNALDMLRRESREITKVEAYKVEYKFEYEMAEDELLQEQEELTLDQIMDLVQLMPPGYRAVFNLYAVEEYSHKEIAEMLGVTESTSKTQYRKAKAYMRNLIQEELNKSISD